MLGGVTILPRQEKKTDHCCRVLEKAGGGKSQETILHIKMQQGKVGGLWMGGSWKAGYVKKIV